MGKYQVRYLIIIVVLGVLTLLVNIFNYDIFADTSDSIAIVRQIPVSFNKWKGTDVYLDPSVYEILETKSIIHRRYTSDIGDVFLSIVYYPDTKVDFHAPEACLGGEGAQVEKISETIGLNVEGKQINLKINQLIRKNPEFKELVYYFYKAGEYMGRSYIALRLNIAKNKFFDNNKSGVLIRVSTALPDKGDAAAEEKLRQFIEKLTPFIVRYL